MLSTTQTLGNLSPCSIAPRASCFIISPSDHHQRMCYMRSVRQSLVASSAWNSSGSSWQQQPRAHAFEAIAASRGSASSAGLDSHINPHLARGRDLLQGVPNDDDGSTDTDATDDADASSPMDADDASDEEVLQLQQEQCKQLQLLPLDEGVERFASESETGTNYYSSTSDTATQQIINDLQASGSTDLTDPAADPDGTIAWLKQRLQRYSTELLRAQHRKRVAREHEQRGAKLQAAFQSMAISYESKECLMS
jgi:hypothetical protein